tara:strand:- start:14 stop:664 length:651 start_codon:yes stop_codon:yes gene_type:complete
MNNIKNVKVTIEDIFNYEPKPPFSVKLDLFSPDNKNVTTLFNKIKDIYIKGLIIQTGKALDNNGPNNLEVENVTQNHINIMEKHMLSFGIKTVFLKMTRNDKDALFRYLLYDLEKAVPALNFHVTMDWRTQHILKIDFKLPTKKKDNILSEVNKIMVLHNVVNIFLKIKKAEKLREHGIIIKKTNNLDDITVIYFDFANIADYQKIHRCMNDKICR